MEPAILDNKLILSAISAVAGILVTLITSQLLNKRGQFSYFVRHFRVGVSADDEVFGSVRVTWNGSSAANLYSSTVELVNESMKDFENVVITAFSRDTILLTERTELVESASVVDWSSAFKRQLDVSPGQVPSEAQMEIHAQRREYCVPVINRGQIIRFHFLNSSKTGMQPSIWLDIVHKGVKLRFRVPQNQVLGIPQPRAALVGALTGVVFVSLVVSLLEATWAVGFVSLLYGFIAQLPGAGVIRAWRWLRESLGG